ncbi:MAG: translation initiation factor IF-2 N-terminal domain-containing protein [Selenomonadaceae bacterium]|nr:translation initiation factor IF-2 N-terminal domain-containing protein [Selenomonadaceae bacterium]
MPKPIKHRVYEIAKELSVNTEDIIDFLNERKINFRNRFSAVDAETYELIKSIFNYGNLSELQRCIACKKVATQSEFFRIVKSGNKIIVDESGKAQGRGVYLCKSFKCVDIIDERRILDDIFKIQVSNELYYTLKEKIRM